MPDCCTATLSLPKFAVESGRLAPVTPDCCTVTLSLPKSAVESGQVLLLSDAAGAPALRMPALELDIVLLCWIVVAMALEMALEAASEHDKNCMNF